MSYFDDVDLDQLLTIDEEIEKENVERSSLVLEATHLQSKRVISETHLENHNLPSVFKSPSPKRAKTETAKGFTNLTPEPLLKLLKRIPLDGDYVSVTFEDGARYYMRVEEALSETCDFSYKFHPCDLASDVMLLPSIKHVDAQETVLKPESCELWTRKHAPKHYFDIISDETTNRALLRWLKAWDSYVYGVTPPNLPSLLVQPSNTTDSKVSQFTPRNNDLEQMAGEIDPRDGLPRYRLVLLAGCPGLGKTTVAHLLAQHAGYQVVEVNASDDRTVSAFKDQLAAIVSTSTSLNTTTGRAGRLITYKPCCLILDEIDGALPAAVELLASAARTALQPGGERRARTKRHATPLVLRRPVICICNDLFASAVRPLRAPGVPCLVLRFPTIDLGRLVARLDCIARKEGVPVDKMLLTQLAELADRDIRSCLNAMQFLKSHLSRVSGDDIRKHLSVEDMWTLIGLGGGLKDVQRSMFDVWKAVFTIPPTRVLAGRINRCAKQQQYWSKTTPDSAQCKDRSLFQSKSTLTARLEHVLEYSDAVGDAPMVAMGIFENYLNGRMKDASLNVAREASNWFVFHDRLFKHIHSHTDYSLLRYPTWLPGWFHLALATPTGLQAVNSKSGGLHWPTAYSTANTTKTHCTAILDQLLANQWNAPAHGECSERLKDESRTQSSIRFLPRRTFLLDVAPVVVTLLSLMCSSLRPLNAQLYSQQEQKNLESLVNVMLNLGLNWTPERNTETGEVEFQLEPALDTVVGLGSTSSKLKSIPHTTKQLITRELNLEQMRRSKRSMHVGEHVKPTATQVQLKFDDVPMPASSHRPPIQSSQKSQSSKGKKDFFGRLIEESSKTAALKIKSKEEIPTEHCALLNQEVYYRFREGYSNAVRRPVTLKHFI
ncbi:ATPase AAA family [Paragonimus heterotremus]|uniref:ATPase AAA family n=1 Tax=Paragonimus heterotremus TaxID=100268 RepID=A0A8J4TJ34_9TREM|nr:ATPase AAA family [Paragonimus heterotremus]